MLPTLTVNGTFMREFISADAPCFALGLVEEGKRHRHSTCGGPTGYRLMRKRQELGESMCTKTEVETVIGLLAAAHPDQPVTSFDLLRSVLADGCRSLDRRLE